jgi:hypothetical protein
MRFLRRRFTRKSYNAIRASVAFFTFAVLTSAHAVEAPLLPNSPLWPRPASDALPNAPEKALVLKYCEVCHGIDWIVRSGGTVEGWSNRLQRMIRAGASIPKDQIPAVAVYLAKAFPPRPRPEDSP